MAVVEEGRPAVGEQPRARGREGGREARLQREREEETGRKGTGAEREEMRLRREEGAVSA